MLVEGASRHYQRQPRGTRCRHLASRIAAFIKGVQTLLDAFFLHTKAKVISVMSPLQVPAEVAMWLWNEVGILKHSSTLHPKLLITSPCLLRVNSTTTKPSTCPSSSPRGRHASRSLQRDQSRRPGQHRLHGPLQTARQSFAGRFEGAARRQH